MVHTEIDLRWTKNRHDRLDLGGASGGSLRLFMNLVWLNGSGISSAELPKLLLES